MEHQPTIDEIKRELHLLQDNERLLLDQLHGTQGAIQTLKRLLDPPREKAQQHKEADQT